MQNIETILKSANGKRRERILTLSQIQDVISTVPTEPGAFAAENAGQVASSYQGRSFTTTVLAVRRTDGKLAVAIGPNRGQQGSASRPYFLAAAVPNLRTNKFALAWADEARNLTFTDGGIAILKEAK